MGIGLNVRVFVTADEEFVEGGEGDIPSARGKCDISKSSPESSPSIEAEEIEGQEASTEVATEKTAKEELPPYSRRSSRTTMQAGRPDLKRVIREAQEKAEGELGVAVCGPVGLTAETRRVVACFEGKGRGIYLHVESFGW